MKKYFCILLLVLFCAMAQAQIAAPRTVSETELNSLRQDFQKLSQEKDLEKAMEKAVQISEALLQQKRYKEAASLYHQMDQLVSNSEKKNGRTNYLLRFMVANQRLRMYTLEGKPESSKNQLNAIQYCMSYLKNETLKDELLLSEAEYYRTFDTTGKSLERYKELLKRCLIRSNEDSRENCYKEMLAYAERNKIEPLTKTVQTQYTAWQDSVKTVQTARELEILKQQHQSLQQDFQAKEKTISNNKLVTIGLWTFIVILIAALLVLFSLFVKSIYRIRKFRNSLKIANESNEQKSHFISNIKTQITPSLDVMESAIDHPSTTIVQQTIASLRKRMDYMQTYISLEETREESFPVTNVDIKLLCENVMLKAKTNFQPGIEAVVMVPRVNVKTNTEILDQILSHLLSRAADNTSSGKISLEFKKRNARTGQFIITDTGSVIEDEKQENLFKPFAETNSENEENWVLPICQLMAYKLNGTLKVDSEYKKGTRFILDLCS